MNDHDEEERLVAIVSPWQNLRALAKKQFRVESLPTQKMVMVWREDLQGEQELGDELRKLGVKTMELKKRLVTLSWKDRM
jgi:hypothetical protein